LGATFVVPSLLQVVANTTWPTKGAGATRLRARQLHRSAFRGGRADLARSNWAHPSHAARNGGPGVLGEKVECGLSTAFRTRRVVTHSSSLVAPPSQIWWSTRAPDEGTARSARRIMGLRWARSAVGPAWASSRRVLSVLGTPVFPMTATQKGKGAVLEVKKSDGQISVKLGSKKSLSEKVSSIFKGK
jgi:hypothetical protein